MTKEELWIDYKKQVGLADNDLHIAANFTVSDMKSAIEMGRDSRNTAYNAAAKELGDRLQAAEAKLKKFKFYGTDGCRGENDTCQSRFQLYYTTDKCIECAPTDYKIGETHE